RTGSRSLLSCRDDRAGDGSEGGGEELSGTGAGAQSEVRSGSGGNCGEGAEESGRRRNRSMTVAARIGLCAITNTHIRCRVNPSRDSNGAVPAPLVILLGSALLCRRTDLHLRDSELPLQGTLLGPID